jgi:hypothetical protein
VIAAGEVRGNDTIDGGAGNDTIVGDQYYALPPADLTGSWRQRRQCVCRRGLIVGDHPAWEQTNPSLVATTTS